MEERIKQLHFNAGSMAGEEKTCGKKNAFETEEKAQKAADNHNKWKERRHDVEPYPCAFCNQWHIGNIMPIDLLEKLKARQDLFDFIKKMVGEAYEVGYHHGWNISRTVPKRENEGWGQYFDNIKERLIKEFNERP